MTTVTLAVPAAPFANHWNQTGKEAGLRALAAAAGVEYPAPDTATLDDLVNVPTVRDLMLAHANGGKKPTSAQLAESSAADSVRGDVQKMRESLYAQTYSARLESILPAVVAAADNALAELVEVSKVLDKDKPFSVEVAYANDSTAAQKRAVALVGHLGVLAGVYGMPTSSDQGDRNVRLMARFVDVPEVKRFAHDDDTVAARAFYAASVKGRHTLAEVLLALCRGEFGSLTPRFAASHVEFQERLARLNAAAVTVKTLAEPLNKHPLMRHWG